MCSAEQGDAQLVAAYTATWAEITRLREYQWKIAYYFLALSAGLIALLTNDHIAPLPGWLKWGVTCAQVIAGVLGVVYMNVTHGYLTEQRNIRRRIEEEWGLSRPGADGREPIMPAAWEGRRITEGNQRLGLVVPLMLVVVVAQGLSLYVLWDP